MTSARKVETNRANARRSTGPKTRAARARSARNALRHGLSLSVRLDSKLDEEVKTMARQIAGSHGEGTLLDLACLVAEALIELRRVRFLRHQFLCEALSNVASFKTRPEMFLGTCEGRDGIAAIFSVNASRLIALDRYERRAISRRKSAMRKLRAASVDKLQGETVN